MRTKKVTSKIMSSIKSKDTKPEKMLGKILWTNGFRYRKNYKIKGKPDFALVKKKLQYFAMVIFGMGIIGKLEGSNH